MHEVIKQHLEEYLEGCVTPSGLPEVSRHLETCADCRKAVDEIARQSQMVKVLRPPEELGPAPCFYARVMERIAAQKRASLWSVFLQPSTFSRRIAYASLVLVMLLGISMLSSDPGEEFGATHPVVILAEQSQGPEIGVDLEQDRASMLVNLTTYEE